MIRRRVLFAVALAAASLAGCKSVGPNFAPPAPPATPGYLMGGDAPSDIATLTPEALMSGARPAGAWWISKIRER